LTFSNSTHSRVTWHLCKFRHIHGDKKSFCWDRWHREYSWSVESSILTSFPCGFVRFRNSIRVNHELSVCLPNIPNLCCRRENFLQVRLQDIENPQP
jgi:hypothetical protein